MQYNHKGYHQGDFKEKWDQLFFSWLFGKSAKSDYNLGISKDLVSFSQAIENSDYEKWINFINDELKLMK